MPHAFDTTRTPSRLWPGVVSTVVCALVFGAGAVALDGCSTDRPSSASVSSNATSPSDLAPATGACPQEGAVRTCKISLGVADGYSKCFVGKQDCRGGVWSDCGNGDVTLSSLPPDLHIAATYSTPKADAGACTGDPCDPYCQGFDVDAGALSADAGSSGSSGSYNAFGGSPPGFANKEVCQGSRACDDTSAGKCNGQDHCNKFDSCLADYHCDTTTHACVNNNGATSFQWPVATCAGVDLTVGPACTDSSGTAGFTVCNRGNTDLAGPASIGIRLLNGDVGMDYSMTPAATQCANGACPKDTPDCTITTAATGIPKGSCVRVTKTGGSGSLACPAWSGSGNPVAFVNSNLAIAECGNSACGANTCTAAGAPGCRNNYADVKDRGTTCTPFGTSYNPVSKSNTYVASCKAGYQVQWKDLGWDSSIPGGDVTFTAYTQPALADGGAGTATSTVTVAVVTTSGSTYPPRCLMGEVSGCPAPLGTALGGTPSTSNAYLTVTATINPSADKTITPTLKGIRVSYRCVPAE